DVEIERLPPVHEQISLEEIVTQPVLCLFEACISLINSKRFASLARVHRDNFPARERVSALERGDQFGPLAPCTRLLHLECDSAGEAYSRRRVRVLEPRVCQQVARLDSGGLMGGNEQGHDDAGYPDRDTHEPSSHRTAPSFGRRTPHWVKRHL